MNIPIKITPDFAAVKTKQQAAWSSGDYAVVGTTLQIVGERLVEAVNVNSNHRVLDVAAGNGNASLAAARHFAEVVSTDYVPELLARGRERAKAEALQITFQEADAENLPFENDKFDVVLSTFGVMFTPDHEKAANEMIRVVKRGGKIGLANWTPESYIGQVFKTIGKYVTPPAGVQSPALWGATAHIDELFGSSVFDQGREAQLRVPLPLAAAHARYFPYVLRTGAQGFRRARHGEAASFGAGLSCSNRSL